MPEAVLVTAVRTPVGRAPKGALSTTRPDDLAATALSGALDKVPGLDKTEIDDVILGCAQPEGEQGWNIARLAALRAGLPVEIPGATVNRLCASGLEAIAHRRSAHPLRRRARHHRRRRRIHEPHSHGRQQAQPQSMARRTLSRLAAHHGPHRRARRPPLRTSPAKIRTPSRSQPPESPRRASRRPLRR